MFGKNNLLCCMYSMLSVNLCCTEKALRSSKKTGGAWAPPEPTYFITIWREYPRF